MTTKAPAKKTPAAKKVASAKPAAAKTASPLPTPATAKSATAAPAPAKTVALRGGAAVAKVTMTGKPYRTAAPHNKDWWDKLTAACKAGPSAVADVITTNERPNGVPAHFVGYCLRRGYLAEAK